MVMRSLGAMKRMSIGVGFFALLVIFPTANHWHAWCNYIMPEFQLLNFSPVCLSYEHPESPGHIGHDWPYCGSHIHKRLPDLCPWF
jgi:hypothetical protein